MNIPERSDRSEAEFLSHFWTASDKKYLHFGWPYDTTKFALILEGGKLPMLDYRGRETLGRCLLDLLFCMELFAAEVLQEQTTFHAEEEHRHSEAVATYRAVRYPKLPWTSPHTIAFCERVLRTYDELQLADILEFGIEPLAVTLTGLLHARAADPLLVRMCSFILADELAHEPESSSIRKPNCEVTGELNELLRAVLDDCVDASGLPHYNIGRFVFEYAPSSIIEYLSDFDLFKDDELKSNSRERRKNLERVAADASEFLELIRTHPNPVPPIALAVEWMAAGLRSSAPLL
jgi:hypothetical protein